MSVRGVAHLEIGKQGPGHYLIEGWDVRRLRAGSGWVATKFEKTLGGNTLREIKEKIVDAHD